MWRRWTVVWVIGLAAAGLGVADPPRARAASCGQEHVCLWRDANMSGCVYEWNGGYIPDMRTTTYQNCPGVALDDSISSVVNNQGGEGWMVFHVEPHEKGAAYCVAPQQAVNVPSKVNDKISSGGGEYPVPDGKPDAC